MFKKTALGIATIAALSTATLAPMTAQAQPHDKPTTAGKSGHSVPALEKHKGKDGKDHIGFPRPEAIATDTAKSAVYLPNNRVFWNDDMYPITSTTDVFNLNSRPGAAKTIYLNFKGATIGSGFGDAWVTDSTGKVTPTKVSGFDLDSNPTAYSDLERQAIYSVWRQTQEAFVPLDVNVTTAAPPLDALKRTDANDNIYGATALITSGTAPNYTTCNCSGIAYEGVVDRPWGDQQKYAGSLTYARDTTNSAQRIANVVIHEAAHNLGVSHDGDATHEYYTGTSPLFQPIMGYPRDVPVRLFDNGSYVGANNKQDDYGVMNSHGFPLRPVVAATTKETAKPLTRGTVMRSSPLS